MALDDSPLEAETVSEDATESMDVPLDQAETAEEQLDYDEDSLNLVEDFQRSEEGKDFLKQAADEVRDNFDQDWESTEEYRKHVENDWRIWAGELPKRTAAFQDAANAHVPILLENMSRIQLRAEGELFGDWSHVFGVLPLGKEDQPDVDLLDLHGNWQIRNQIPDFKRQIASRGLLLFLGPGDVTVHSFYDEARKMNRHEVLSCDEFVIPYVYTTTMPDYSDVPRRTKILPRYKHELEQMRGIWSDVDKVLEREGPGFEDDPDQPMARAVAEVQGIEIPTDGKAPYKVLWYEGWMTLPKQDRQRFVQVIMDYDSKTIFRMTIHEEPSWQDKAEYEMRLNELLAYRQAFGAYEQAMQQHQGMQAQLGQQLGSAQIGPEQALAGLQGLDAQEPQPPMAPTWMQDPNDPAETPPQPEKKPIHLFTHGVCLENVRGSLGLGYGRIMADYNRAANVSLTQWNDANTLANCKGFITTDNVEMTENFRVQPGGLYKVTGVSGGELKDNLIPFSFDSANPALLENVKLMQSFGEGAMQAPAVLSGAEGKSGETYRGIAARIEQATKQLSVLTRKYANEVLLPVLRNNAYLNSIHLADEELIQIERNILPENVQNPIKITRKLYERNYMVEIKSDLQFASRAQKIQESDDVLNLVKGIPQLQQNIPLMYQITKKCLMARGFRDLAMFLGPEPPPPPAPMGIMPPPPPGPPGSTGKPGAPPGPPGMPPAPPMPNAPGGPPQGMAS